MLGLAILVALIPLAIAFGLTFLSVVCQVAGDLLKALAWLLLALIRLPATLIRYVAAIRNSPESTEPRQR